MYLTRNQRILATSLATCATLVVVLKLSQQAPVEFRLPELGEVAQPKSVSGPVVPVEVGRKEGKLGKVGDVETIFTDEKPKLSSRMENVVLADKLAKDESTIAGLEEIRGDSPKLDIGLGAAGPLTERQKNEISRLLTSPQALQEVGWGLTQPANAGRFGSLPCSTCILPADPANTEQYIAYNENPRIFVADEAISTFSIDVDTGSYTNVRRFLQSGQLPPADSVRIEEFINYFSYNYPVQHEKPFTLSYELAPAPLDKGRFLLKLGIKARDPQPSEKPWNLVFLIDVSGSMMDPNKLELIKRSLPLLVNSMRPEDKIAIVTYAGNAGLVLDSTTIKEKEKILNAIETLYPGGSTNGAGGINLAYQVAERNKISGGVNRVVLATDGDFNVGLSSTEALVKMIEEKRHNGVTLTTLGFGAGNLKDGTMEQLANKGNGNYFYLDSFKEARKVLQDQLAGNMEVVAKDVKLQLEFNPEHVSQYRLVGYDNRRLKKEEFNDDKIDAGEIGAGHTVTALYEIVLTDSELAKQLETEYRYQETLKAAPKVVKDKVSELAFLKIRYKEPEGVTSTLLQYPLERSQVKELRDTTDDFRFTAAVAYFGTLLRESQFKGDYTFADIAKLAAEARGTDANGYRQEFIELVKNAAAIKR